jgi:alkanesulfonate monooxygenase SsuD/methylene tetrahydromethanopterin reductase-like flavin-dependent oxidoreductase (luciferase family)
MTICPMMCLEDGDEARAIYAANAAHVAAHFSVYFDTIPANAERIKGEPRPIPQRRLRELIERVAQDPELRGPIATSQKPDREFLYQNGICVGTPKDVIETIKRYEDIGIDQLVTIPVIGFKTPHDKTLESIRVMGEKVLPALRGKR